MPAARDRPTGRAILDREIFHSRDHDAEPGLLRLPHYDTVKSSVVVPMVRGDVAIGALAMGSRDRGGFSDTQVDLLKTFAEQAVIAIGSAETYRALRGGGGRASAIDRIPGRDDRCAESDVFICERHATRIRHHSPARDDVV